MLTGELTQRHLLERESDSLTGNTMEKEEIKTDASQEENTQSQESESSTENGKQEGNENAQGEQKQEQQVPFHEHPRFKELITEKNTFSTQLQEALSKIAALEQRNSPTEKSQVKLPAWFAEGFGNNPDLYAKYMEETSAMRTQIKKEILDEIGSQQKKQQDATAKWDKYVKDSLETLKADGLQFDDNELLATAEKWLPTNAKGDIDFRKAYEIYALTQSTEKSEKSRARKEMGALGAPDKKGEQATGTVKTWKDFVGKTGF